MNEKNVWNVNDGNDNITCSTDELRDKYEIDTSYFMFPKDTKLISNDYKHKRRKRDKKMKVIKLLAERKAEEERHELLKDEYKKFMALPAEEQGFDNFFEKLVKKIETPSIHKVKGAFLF